MNIYLVHQVVADRDELVEHLEEIGHDVTVASELLDEDLPALKVRQPDVIVAFLGEAADDVIARVETLKRKRCARSAAVLFTGGDAAAMEAAGKVFPRASFARRAVLMNAIASARG